MHIIYLRAKITVYLGEKNQIALLLSKKITILEKYLEFINIFLRFSYKATYLFYINKYLINLKPDKLPLYKPIYSQKPIKLEILKIYIKNSLANSFL